MKKQIPIRGLTKIKRNQSKARCDGCGKEIRIRYIVNFKGKFLCGKCRKKRKSFRIQESASLIGKGRISLDEALERIYEIKGYCNHNNNRTFCSISLPICLAEKFVKLKLVDNNENSTKK